MIPLAAYCTPHEKTSPVLAAAFARGAGGIVVSDLHWREDAAAAAMMPSPHAASWALHQRGMAGGKPWFSLNKGYFRRGQFFRATYRALQHDGRGQPGPRARHRFDALRIPIRPWRRSGSHILLCPNSPRWFEMRGTSFDAWRARVMADIAAHTDRPVRIRWKSDRAPLEADLCDAWAVVIFDSTAGLEAALAGVPVFATTECPALRMGCGDLARIEDPPMPDGDQRYAVACVLAANQWTLDEMRAGQCWRDIQTRAEAQAA